MQLQQHVLELLCAMHRKPCRSDQSRKASKAAHNTQHWNMPAGGVVLLLLIVLSGYAIIRTSVPPW